MDTDISGRRRVFQVTHTDTDTLYTKFEIAQKYDRTCHI